MRDKLFDEYTETAINLYNVNVYGISDGWDYWGQDLRTENSKILNSAAVFPTLQRRI